MTQEYTLISNLYDQLTHIPPNSIVSQTFFQDESQKSILFGFAPGQELSEHTAARPAVLHFLEGEAELALGSDSFSVQAGAWVHMQAHLSHSIKAKTELLMLLILL
jgi:quercetin dioxygenase-like cupin family protein